MRSYQTFNYPNAEEGSKTLLTGIRAVENSKNKVYISGFYEPPTDSSDPVISFVYKGCPHGNGSFYSLDYPSEDGLTVVTTNLYGPNNGSNKYNIHNNTLQVVGNYTTVESGSSTIGCLYEGQINGEGIWTTIIPSPLTSSPILNTICHSNMGGLVVGNYDTILIQGQAFIYDIKRRHYYNITKAGAKSITAYGIWYNANGTYTICGSYSNLDPVTGVTSGYLVDWDNKFKLLSNWREYSYGNNPVNAIVTHFDGITSDDKGGFYLTGDSVDIKQKSIAFFAHVNNKHEAKWSEIEYPNSIGTSGNTVLQTMVLGVYAIDGSETVNGYISFT